MALALCTSGCTETATGPTAPGDVNPNAQVPAPAAVENPNLNNPAPVRASWMRPGTVLVYDCGSAFRKADQYSNGAHSLWTTEITGIQGTIYTATVTVSNAEYAGMPSQTYYWTCPNLQALDQLPLYAPPANPLAFFPSLYQLAGRSPYPVNQFYGNAYATNDAIMVSASIPESGVLYTATIDGQTGCLLSASSKYPSEEIYLPAGDALKGISSRVGVTVGTYEASLTTASASGLNGFMRTASE